MPFYLVTQTSLVEADNEQAAAQKQWRSFVPAGRSRLR